MIDDAFMLLMLDHDHAVRKEFERYCFSCARCANGVPLSEALPDLDFTVEIQFDNGEYCIAPAEQGDVVKWLRVVLSPREPAHVHLHKLRVINADLVPQGVGPACGIRYHLHPKFGYSAFMQDFILFYSA
jgi:hypothetical protein